MMFLHGFGVLQVQRESGFKRSHGRWRSLSASSSGAARG
jgi:hypothetical protein